MKTMPKRGVYKINHSILVDFIKNNRVQGGKIGKCCICGKSHVFAHDELKSPMPPCENGCDPEEYIANLQNKTETNA